jgi:hypothetical protein
MTDDASWIKPAFIVFAAIGSVLAMYIMKTAQNKDDPPLLRDARRYAFFIAASLLLFASAYALSGWQVSLPVLVLLMANDVLLALNAVSLYLRIPPKDGDKVAAVPPDQVGYYLAMALVDIERLDRGQKLTHDYLQAMHNDREMKTDRAIIYPTQFQPRKP